MTISITLGGTDITDNVHLHKSNFTSQVSGSAGSCVIAIKDPTLAANYVIGSRILLTIDGLNQWAGYLKRKRHVYPFRAYSPTSTREFVLIGADINILFQSRVIHKLSDPTDDGIIFPPGTDDTEAIEELVENWLDLDGDDLNVSTHVANVGTLSDEDPTAPIKPGEMWFHAMAQMSRWSAPVWYINPDRELVWADVDVESAPWGVSDDPTGAEHGVRNFSIIKDGTELANDAIFVGMSPGAAGRVSHREEATSSIDDHGRWQYGALVTDVYKQSSITRLAEAWVHGSPGSRRGHKNDKVTVNFTTFDHGLRAGMVVNVRSAVWDFEDAIPIRQMRISWDVHSATKYDCLLTHEIDVFTLFDPWKIPPFGGGFPPIDPPDIIITDPGPPPPEPCDPDILVYDTFSRTVASEDPPVSFGVTEDDLHRTWRNPDFSDETWVDGSRAVFGNSELPVNSPNRVELNLPHSTFTSLAFDTQTPSLPWGGFPGVTIIGFEVNLYEDSLGSVEQVYLAILGGGYEGVDPEDTSIQLGWGNDDGTTDYVEVTPFPDGLDWTVNNRVEIEISGNTLRARLYPVGSTPPDWQVSLLVTGPHPMVDTVSFAHSTISEG